MDKFGILKLLTSLYSQEKKEKPETDTQTPKENPSLKLKESEKPTPLQLSMLSTMRSHDEFVERVLKNK